MDNEVRCRNCGKLMSPGAFPVCQRCWDTVALEELCMSEQVGAGLYCPECHASDDHFSEERLACKNSFHVVNRPARHSQRSFW